MLCYLRVHFIHMTATAPPPMTVAIKKIAMFCQKWNVLAKKASEDRMKTSQQTPTIAVPATLDPRLMFQSRGRDASITFAYVSASGKRDCLLIRFQWFSFILWEIAWHAWLLH